MRAIKLREATFQHGNPEECDMLITKGEKSKIRKRTPKRKTKKNKQILEKEKRSLFFT